MTFNQDQMILNIEIGGLNKNIFGTYKIQVMLQDDHGASSNQSFKIIIRLANT